MVWSDSFHPNGNSTFIQWFGFAERILCAVQVCEIDQASGHIDILGAKRFLPNCNRAFEQGLCLCILALRRVNGRKVIDGRRDIWMVLLECFFTNGKRTLEKRF